MMKQKTEKMAGHERIHGHGVNLLNENVPFPKGFDAIWMSQFLDCFPRKKLLVYSHGLLSPCLQKGDSTLWKHSGTDRSSKLLPTA